MWPVYHLYMRISTETILLKNIYGKKVFKCFQVAFFYLSVDIFDLCDLFVEIWGNVKRHTKPRLNGLFNVTNLTFIYQNFYRNCFALKYLRKKSFQMFSNGIFLPFCRNFCTYWPFCRNICLLGRPHTNLRDWGSW